jgi:S1-C subfamily serine protease
VNVTDVLLVLGVLIFAVLGFYRGFTAQTLSLGGLALGALLGSFAAPHLLADNSPWLPLASLAGALVGAFFLGTLAVALGTPIQRFLRSRPRLALADHAGGILAGSFLGLAFAWLVAVLALQQPALGLRERVQESAIMPRLLRAVPPSAVLRALNRFDPLPLLPGISEELPKPDPSVLRSRGARAAMAGVVKIHGSSCGVGVQGSGWVVRRALVATNAHVVAGQTDTQVLAPNGQTLDGRVVYVDATNDVALLRVQGLRTAPLAPDESVDLPRPVALLGYPRNGPLTSSAATAGDPRTVLAPDAYRRRVRPRVVVPLRGAVEPGESGGPVVDRRGAVIAMVFGGTRRGRDGYAVPVSLVLRGLSGARGAANPGPCLE